MRSVGGPPAAMQRYVEPGAPFNPDRAGTVVGILVAVAFYAWLLLLVLALFRYGWGRWRWRRREARGTRHRAAPLLAAEVDVPGAPDHLRSEPAQPRRPEWPRATQERLSVHPSTRWTSDDDAMAGTVLSAAPGELRLLSVSRRTIRHDEPLRLDWYVPDADRVLIDGEVHDPAGAVELTVTASRNVVLQAFRGDRLLRSVSLPVTVLPAPAPAPEVTDWLGPPAAALERALASRPLFPPVPYGMTSKDSS